MLVCFRGTEVVQDRKRINRLYQFMCGSGDIITSFVPMGLVELLYEGQEFSRKVLR